MNENHADPLLLDRPVVIASSGRCGSTLLQAILNTNPEFLIWGEHNAFLHKIADAYFSTLTGSSFFPDSEVFPPDERMLRLRDKERWIAWDNLCGREEFRRNFQIFIRSFFAGADGTSRRWGFKEIRYPADRSDRVLPLMLECFPAARFVILIREAATTIFSMLSSWIFARLPNLKVSAADVDERVRSTALNWAYRYSELYLFCQANPSQTLCVRYEDTHSPQLYETLAKFLETSIPFDYAAHLCVRKDPCIKDDEVAALIRSRMDAMRPEMEAITRETSLLYGYSIGDRTARAAASLNSAYVMA